MVIKSINTIKFFYAEKENWSDESYHEKLLSDIANVNAELTNVAHKVVLKKSV